MERQLAIIGETLNHFRKVESKFQIENDTQIVFLRNRLIHSYDNIDEAIIWAILKRHILPFKKEVEKLLE